MFARTTAAVVAVALAVGARPSAADSPLPTPQPGRVVVTDTSIEILGPIRFVGATTLMTGGSRKMLDAIAATLDGNPAIRVMEVRAYGGDAPPGFQKRLAEGRAKAIVLQLTGRGVAPARLRWRGIARSPRGTDGSPELYIVDRDGER